jgi:hypothetical protein
MFSRILRDPILHFLAAGFALFVLTRFLAGPPTETDSDRLIRIERADLLTYMQYQANAFDADSFARALDNMSASELQQLIDDHVAEEVLYREARALGLEQSDYLIRQRMVDKMRFLLGESGGKDAAPTTDELQSWLEQNPEAYRIDPYASFTHVFIDFTDVGIAQARKQAEAMLADLNSNKVGFDQASNYGDRFPFLRNYVERTLDFVRNNFGSSFAGALQQLQPAEGLWQGPLQSDYGYHLVMLTALTPASDPALEDVLAEVTQDYILMRNEERLRQIVKDVRAQYQVDTSAVLQGQE